MVTVVSSSNVGSSFVRHTHFENDDRLGKEDAASLAYLHTPTYPGWGLALRIALRMQRDGQQFSPSRRPVLPVMRNVT
jgi:hypothetical protein